MVDDDLSPGEAALAALDAGDLAGATAQMHRHVRLHKRMGLAIVFVSEGSAVMTVELSEETQGSGPGTIHGGLLATFADATAAMAVSRSVDTSTHIQATTDMHVRYFRQPRSGPLTATATLVHRGRQILSTECVIVDADERVLARATATYMVVPRPF